MPKSVDKRKVRVGVFEFLSKLREFEPKLFSNFILSEDFGIFIEFGDSVLVMHELLKKDGILRFDLGSAFEIIGIVKRNPLSGIIWFHLC